MARNIIKGNWEVWQDAPEYGCTDNPSYDWLAMEYRNGHWTGRTAVSKSLSGLLEKISK